MNPRTFPTESLSLHPEAARVPDMPPEQYASFAADVKARGVLTRVKLKPGTMIVLDGRTRLRAAKDAGIEHIPVEDAVLDDNDPDGLLYMLRAELNRRHLTPDQRAGLAADLEESFAADAKERRNKGAAKGGQTGGRGRPKDSPVANSPQDKPAPAPKARDHAAAATGAKPRAVSDAKLVKQKAPALHEKVKAGTMKLAEAKRTVKGDPPTKQKAAESLARPKPSSPVVPLGGGIGQYPIPFLISELEETISWINERADVLDAIVPTVPGGPRAALQLEATHLRGRVALIRQVINKARDAQWEKEKK